MHGKLIILEGIDGSGKTTQTEALLHHFKEQGKNARRLKFPDYDSDSSALVKMYLRGEFGTNPDDVNAYAASAFYAVDRFASYKKDWKADYDRGVMLVSDRYTSSNVLHQCGKLPEGERKNYLDWLYDLEYARMQIPKPDAVFFLDVPPEISLRQVEKRYAGDETKKDIHEQNKAYLHTCYEMGLYACRELDFIRVPCTENGKMLPQDVIFSWILNHLEL